MNENLVFINENIRMEGPKSFNSMNYFQIIAIRLTIEIIFNNLSANNSIGPF